MNGFEARERPVAPHREMLARRLFEEHREAGGTFWEELAPREKEQWFRVARHIERNTSAGTIRDLSAP